MKNQLQTIAGIVLCFWSLTLLAQTPIPDSPEQRKMQVSTLEQELKSSSSPAKKRELAMIYAVIAGLDDPRPETTHKAELMLEQAEKLFPDDFEVMAAHGSVLTMLAQFETETAKQLHYVKKGFRKMDRAIKKAPENIGALLQRGNNSLNMPVFLRRAHYAKKDFQQILDLTGDRRGPGFKAMILFNLGQAHALMKETDQAVKIWQEVVALKAPYWSDKAAESLKK